LKCFPLSLTSSRDDSHALIWSLPYISLDLPSKDNI